MRSCRAAVAVLVSLFFVALAFSQPATTALHGTVYDVKGAVLSGATVTVSDPQTGFSRTTMTDKDGGYHLLQLPPSTYAVTVDAAGFCDIEARQGAAPGECSGNLELYPLSQRESRDSGGERGGSPGQYD